MKICKFFQALRDFMVSMYSTGRNPYEAIYNIQVTLDCGAEGKLRKIWESIEFGIEDDEETDLPEGLKEAIGELERGEVTEVTQEDWDKARAIVQKRREELDN